MAKGIGELTSLCLPNNASHTGASSAAAADEEGFSRALLSAKGAGLKPGVSTAPASSFDDSRVESRRSTQKDEALSPPFQSATVEQSLSDGKVSEARTAKRHAIALKRQAKHNRLIAMLFKRDAKHSRAVAQSRHDAQTNAKAKQQRLKEASREH